MYENMLKALQNNSETTVYEKYMQRMDDFQKAQEDEVYQIRKTYDNQLLELKQKWIQHEINEKNMESQLEHQK